MNTSHAPGAPEAVQFGPFRLVPGERMLTRDGVAVELGGRALDVLMVLIARANKVVSKRELMAQAWPGVVVSEGSLRFQIAMLRQALGDGKNGARYISNVVSRGYCFVGEVSRGDAYAVVDATAASSALEPNLPAQLTELVGRAEDIKAISTQLAITRLVTLVGAGGVGKTTVAVRIGHDLLDDFDGAVFFVDFAALSDAALVPTAIAAMLRLSVRSADPVPSLIAYLRDKRVLLILDNCEHVIDAAAILSERIFHAAPGVHILATSREPLHAQGENVYRLEPLASPPDQPGLTAELVLAYPATRLFVHRAGASGARLDLSDSDAPVVANICRKLDGLALAIELAARRVSAYGLHQTAALLDERLTLAWRGQRTAQPRHQTLQATLDWSYELLDDRERLVLGQLPVFMGDFSLDAARHVAATATLEPAQVVDAIASLAEKSLLAIHRSGSSIQYRLLESTRTYALSKAGEAYAGAARRHARYFRDWLELAAAKAGAFSSDAGRASALADLGNVRAALEWCFGPGGDRGLGVALAAAAVPAFMSMSLLAECHRWTERALSELTDEARDGRAEMHLQASLGLSMMFTRGNSDRVRLALERSLRVAEELEDVTCQVQLLGSLQIFHERIGEFVVSLDIAQRSADLAAKIDDPATTAVANSMVGLCRHLVGDQAQARTLLEAAIRGAPGSLQASTIYLGFDHRNRASIALARTLWLLGHPDQAVLAAQSTVEEARRLDHPVTHCIALIWAVSVYLWVGDHARAESDINRFIAYAESHSLTPYLAVGRGVKGELAIRRGDPERGVRAIESCLVELHETRYELLTTAFNLSLSEGLLATGRTNDAIGLLDETIALVHRNGDLYNLPELLRVKARCLLHVSEPNAEGPQACLVESLSWSRRQNARSWELRASTDLARIVAGDGRHDEAIALLQPVVARFEEGFETKDVREAIEWLRRFERDNACRSSPANTA